MACTPGCAATAYFIEGVDIKDVKNIFRRKIEKHAPAPITTRRRMFKYSVVIEILNPDLYLNRNQRIMRKTAAAFLKPLQRRLRQLL